MATVKATVSLASEAGFKNQSIQLNIVSDLNSQLGAADNAWLTGKKYLSSVIEGYEKGKAGYAAIIPTAQRYIEMAKALGEAGIQKSLENVIKDANGGIKQCEAAISKLKSI